MCHRQQPGQRCTGGPASIWQPAMGQHPPWWGTCPWPCPTGCCTCATATTTCPCTCLTRPFASQPPAWLQTSRCAVHVAVSHTARLHACMWQLALAPLWRHIAGVPEAALINGWAIVRSLRTVCKCMHAGFMKAGTCWEQHQNNDSRCKSGFCACAGACLLCRGSLRSAGG